MSFRWIILCLIALPVFAADPTLQKQLKAVENRYNRAQTLQISFHESYTAPQRPPRTETGTLMLRKPGRMRWDYTSPKGKLFVSDGKDLFLYTPHNNQVEKMKMKESEDMRAPLAFLLGKLNFDKEFRNIQARPEGSDTYISAEPKIENLPYTQVDFVITPASEIRRVRVTGYDKSVLDFEFTNEVLNPKLDSKLFQFQTPPGAIMADSSH